MGLSRTILMAVALCAAIGTAPAQAQAFRCPKPGTEVTYSTGGTVRFTGAGASIECERQRISDKARLAPLVGHVLTRNDQNEVNRHYQKLLPALWPLEPGKRSGAPLTLNSTDGNATTYSFTFSVDGRETIEVGAGRFETVVIVLDERGAIANGFYSQQRWWWSPDLGLTLRYRYRVMTGTSSNPPQDWEVTAVKAAG